MDTVPVRVLVVEARARDTMVVSGRGTTMSAVNGISEKYNVAPGATTAANSDTSNDTAHIL